MDSSRCRQIKTVTMPAPQTLADDIQSGRSVRVALGFRSGVARRLLDQISFPNPVGA